MKRILFYGLTVAVAAVACSKEQAVIPMQESHVVRFEASMSESHPDSEVRAGYDGVKSIWHAGDEIGVTFDVNRTNLEFVQTSGSLSSDGRTVKFEGKVPTQLPNDVECVAYYPYSSSATVSGRQITTMFPAVQNFVAGGYRGIPLFGAYSGSSSAIGIQFKNLFSVIRLTLTKDASLTDPVNLQKIVFKGNNNEVVAGDMSVDMSGVSPVVSYTGNDRSVTLDCGVGVALTAAPATFYIAVPALNYTKGYTFTIHTDKGLLIKSVKNLGADYATNTVYATPTLAVKDLVTPIVIADVNLRTLLETLGLIHVVDALSGSVTVTAAGLVVTTLDLSGGNINSLVGIEHFPLLATLNVANNNLQSLDLSKNLLLVSVNLAGNELASLTLGANTLLKTLDVSNNKLTSLDVAANTGLLSLDVSSNELTTVDVSSKALLTTLKVSGNNLSTLNISGVPGLLNLELTAGVNSILLTKLTIPAGATVRNLVSDNTKWVTFESKNNPNIQTISLKNNALLSGVTVTGNSALVTLDVTNTLLLTILGINASANASGFHIVGK